MTPIVSIGGVCNVAYNLRKIVKVSEAFPFDWIKISIGDLIAIFENDFKLFLTKKHYYQIRISDKHFVDKGESIIVGHRKYPSIKFCHDFNNVDDFDTQLNNVIEKYTRRIDRLKKMFVDNETVILVRYQLTKITDEALAKLVDIIETKYDVKVELRIIFYFVKDVKTKFMFWIDDKIMDDWKCEHLDWKEIFDS